MKVQCKNGRNQRGISFVKSIPNGFEEGPVFVEFNGKHAITTLKQSDRVPPDIIILDNSIQQRIGCSDDSLVSLSIVDGDIVNCREAVLSVVSTKGIDSQDIAEALSQRIRDLKPLLDGLILREGDVLEFDSLGIKLVIDSLVPKSKHFAKIKWSELQRVELVPAIAKSKRKINLFTLVDVSIIKKAKSEGSIENPVENWICDLTGKIIRFLHSEQEYSLFASAIYSSEPVFFETYSTDTGEKTILTQISDSSIIAAYENWLHTKSDEISIGPANPGRALVAAIEYTNLMCEENGYDVLMILISNGAYSSGPNPIKLLKESDLCGFVSFWCISLGDNVDSPLLDGIGAVMNGSVTRASTDSETNEIVTSIFSKLSRRVNYSE